MDTPSHFSLLVLLLGKVTDGTGYVNTPYIMNIRSIFGCYTKLNVNMYHTSTIQALLSFRCYLLWASDIEEHNGNEEVPDICNSETMIVIERRFSPLSLT